MSLTPVILICDVHSMCVHAPHDVMFKCTYHVATLLMQCTAGQRLSKVDDTFHTLLHLYKHARLQFEDKTRFCSKAVMVAGGCDRQYWLTNICVFVCVVCSVVEIIRLKR